MAEVTRRRMGELARGALKILVDQPEGVPAKEVLARLETLVPPTDFEREDYPRRPGVRRFEKIVRFSTIAPVKAGWLVKNKGLWSITDEGRVALEKFRDPQQFSDEVRRLYRQWKQQQPESVEAEAEEEIPSPATTVEEAEESSWSEVERHLNEMSPYDFQDLVAGLLRGMGYHVVWVAPPGPDRGVDVIAQSDPLGITGPRIKVQVKRSGDRMPVKEIRSFLAVLSDGDVGLFVSKGGFTKEAEDEARNQEKRRVMMVDLRRLFDLWVEHYEKIPEEQRRLLPLKPVYFLSPPEGAG